jgi:hypothetical protein
MMPTIGRVVAEQLRKYSIESDIVLEPVRRDPGPVVDWPPRV